MKIIPNPVTIIHIRDAVFEQGEIVIFPNTEGTAPEELAHVARYLFGESAQIIHDYAHGHECIRLTNVTFVVANSTSVHADWVIEREEPAIISTEENS